MKKPPYTNERARQECERYWNDWIKPGMLEGAMAATVAALILRMRHVEDRLIQMEVLMCPACAARLAGDN